MEGGGVIVLEEDDGSAYQVDVNDFKPTLVAVADMLVMIQDWEDGRFTMTLDQYLTLPNALKVVVREYHKAKPKQNNVKPGS